LLRECYRVLKEGGVLRIVVPDAEKIIRLYCDDSSPELSDLMIHFYRGKFKTKMEVVNEIFHSATVQQAHHFGWDFETMKFRIQEAGFNRCEKMSAGVSIDKKLQIDHLPWEPVSLYVDAVK
jgi:predicted SAM-dependent methyltransferase